MSDMVHNTLKKLRKGNNSPVCYGGCFGGGGGEREWWDGLFKKGFSLRGTQRTSRAGGAPESFPPPLCGGECAPTFGDVDESVKDGTTGRQRRHAGWKCAEENETLNR